MQNPHQPNSQELLEPHLNYSHQYENQVVCSSNNYMFQQQRPPFRNPHSSTMHTSHQYNRVPSMPPSINYSSQPLPSYQNCLQSQFHSNETHYHNQNYQLAQNKSWQPSLINHHSSDKQITSHHIPATLSSASNQHFRPNDVWMQENSHHTVSLSQSCVSQSQNSYGVGQMTSQQDDPLHSLKNMVFQGGKKPQIISLSKNISSQETNYLNSEAANSDSSYFTLSQNNICSSSESIPTLKTFSDQEIKDDHSLDSIISPHFEDHIQALNSENIVNNSIFDTLTNPDVSSPLEINLHDTGALSNTLNCLPVKNIINSPENVQQMVLTNDNLNNTNQERNLTNFPEGNYKEPKPESFNSLLTTDSETKLTSDVNKDDLASYLINKSSLENDKNFNDKILPNNDFFNESKKSFTNSEAGECKLEKKDNIQNNESLPKNISSLNQPSFPIINSSKEPLESIKNGNSLCHNVEISNTSQNLFHDISASKDAPDNSFQSNCESLKDVKVPKSSFDANNVNDGSHKISEPNHHSLGEQAALKDDSGSSFINNLPISLNNNAKENDAADSVDSPHDKALVTKLENSIDPLQIKSLNLENEPLASQAKISESNSIESNDKHKNEMYPHNAEMKTASDKKSSLKNDDCHLELNTTSNFPNDKGFNKHVAIENMENSTSHEDLTIPKKVIINGEDSALSAKITLTENLKLDATYDSKKKNLKMELLSSQNLQHKSFDILNVSPKTLSPLTNGLDNLQVDEETLNKNVQVKEKYLMVKAPIQAATEISINSNFHNGEKFHQGAITCITNGIVNNVDIDKDQPQSPKHDLCNTLETPLHNTSVNVSGSLYKSHPVSNQSCISNERNAKTNFEKGTLNKSKKTSTSLQKDENSVTIVFLPKTNDNLDCKNTIFDKNSNYSEQSVDNNSKSFDESEKKNLHPSCNANNAKDNKKFSRQHFPKKELMGAEDDDTLTSVPSPKGNFGNSQMPKDGVVEKDKITKNDKISTNNEDTHNSNELGSDGCLLSINEPVSDTKEKDFKGSTSHNISKNKQIKKNNKGKKNKSTPFSKNVSRKSKIPLRQRKGRNSKKATKIESPSLQEPDKSPKSKKVNFSGPFVHVEGQKAKPLSYNIVNVTNKEKDELKEKITTKQEGLPEITSQKKIGPIFSSTLSPSYDAFTKDKTWLCCFCRKGSHYQSLGDLYGPYYVDYFQKNYPKKEISLPNQHEPLPPRRVVRSKRKRSQLVEEFFQSSKKCKQSGKTSRGVQTDDLIVLHDQEGKEHQTSEVWLHEECATWTPGVFLSGQRIFGLEEALQAASTGVCSKCKQIGASLSCMTRGCKEQYHYLCSKDKGCEMNEDSFSILCPKHKQASPVHPESWPPRSSRRPIKGRAIQCHSPSSPPRKRIKKSSFSRS